jgi:hypothetical protein
MAKSNGNGQETAKKQGVGYKRPPKDKQFKKGYDPRRNMNGVPKEAIEMRHLLREIAAEVVKIKEESGDIREVTRLYARARLAFSSRNFKEFELILKALYPGLLREEIDVTSGGEKIKGYIGISPAEWDKADDDKK